MRGRITWLDGIRGAAALFVVLHHIWLRVWPAFPEDTGPWWLGWLLYGHLAVAVFIVVSGFSLSLGPIRHGARLSGGLSRFLRRRAWRIIPPYWAALAFSTLVAAVFLHRYGSNGELLRAVSVHGLLLQDVIGSHTPNGAFWSIAVEWQIYFLFPVILWIGRASGLGTAVATTVAVVLMAHFVGDLGAPFDKIDHLTPQFLALFALGVLAVRVGSGVRANEFRRPLLIVAGTTMALLIAGALLVGSRWMVARYFYVDLVFGLAVACALGALLTGGAPPIRRVLESRPSRGLGRFSYSLYLVHEPILALIYRHVVQPLGLAPVAEFSFFVAVAVPTALVVSYGFHLVFEAPFLEHRGIDALRAMPLWRLVPRRPAPAVRPIELASAAPAREEA